MSLLSGILLGAFWIAFVIVPPAGAALAGSRTHSARIAATVGTVTLAMMLSGTAFLGETGDSGFGFILLGLGVLILISGPAVATVVAVTASRNIED